MVTWVVENVHYSRDEESSTPKGWIRENTKISPVLEVTTNYHHGKPGIEIGIASLSGDESYSWVRISNGLNKFLKDSTEKTRILGEDESTSASTPTSFPIHERNWIHIEPNGRRLGYRKAANNDAHASVRVALHVSRCGERGSHHRAPRRFAVQGLCTCPFRIARPSLLRTLPSPKGPARFLANLTTSSCNLFNGANPADNTFDIGPQQEAVHCKAFKIVDVLCTRVALGRLYLVRCFMKRTKTTVDRLSWPFARGVAQQLTLAFSSPTHPRGRSTYFTVVFLPAGITAVLFSIPHLMNASCVSSVFVNDPNWLTFKSGRRCGGAFACHA